MDDLSAVAQATALAALEHADTLLGYVEQLKAELDRLVAELRAMGYEVTESDANFVQFGAVRGLPRGLAEDPRRGVLVRDNGAIGWRGSPPAPRPNDVFLDAVR